MSQVSACLPLNDDCTSHQPADPAFNLFTARTSGSTPMTSWV
jgi:hypothetical protein